MVDRDQIPKKLAFIETCVRDVVSHRLDDLLDFAEAVRARMHSKP